MRTRGGEGPSYVKKSGIKLEDEGEDAAVNVLREEPEPKLHLNLNQKLQ